MQRFKTTARIEHVMEYLLHAEEAARVDANAHNIDASPILQHLQSAREAMLEAARELEELLRTLDPD
jgi:hypothetical protein